MHASINAKKLLTDEEYDVASRVVMKYRKNPGKDEIVDWIRSRSVSYTREQAERICESITWHTKTSTEPIIYFGQKTK